MTKHTRRLTYILWLLIVMLALVMARSLVHSNGQTLDNHAVPKRRSVALGLSEHISVRAAGHGNPYVNLRDGHDLLTTYVGESSPAQMLQQGQAHPSSLTSADFDEDGVPDLVSGYSSSGGGVLALYRGNVDSIFPNAPEAKAHRVEGSFVDSPFFPSAKVFEIPDPADFIEAGDFDGDGHWDAVTAARGSALLHLFSGNGRGDIKLTKSIQLPGAVTTLVAGEVNRRDGLTDLAVGISGLKGPKVLVFESPLGALLGEPEVFSVPAEVTAMAMGQLDDEYTMDLAIGAGSQLLVIHGRDRRLSLDEFARNRVSQATISKHSLEFTIKSIALGDFTGEHQREIATLMSSGEVKVVSEDNRKQSLERKKTLWLPGNWSEASRLLRAKISSLPQDDLVLVDPSSRQIHVLAGGKERESSATVVTSLDMADEPVAALPMRLNSDALDDLVILRKGRTDATVTLTSPLSTFVVNSTADGSDCDVNDGVCSLGTKNPNSGQCVLTSECTLRAAIQQANASAGLDAISFSIGSGIQTITPLSGLPPITSPVIIDGTTQPGFSGSPIIELNGASAGASVRGLTIAAGSSTIKGLVINRFGDTGIYIFSNGGNTIQGNFIGTDVTGTVLTGNSGEGVLIVGAANNTIGGTVAGAQNVISGNNFEGIYFFGATGNFVQGNLIGIDVTGKAGLDNHESGVLIVGGGSHTIGGTVVGARNVISGNILGISIQTGSTGNLVQGNLIGTDVSGTADLGNDGGVNIGGANNTIGGTAVGARNVISGNDSRGIEIAGFAGYATGNLVQGNLIGTDVTGTAGLGNSSNGVYIGGVDNNTVGGTVGGARNVISGNSQNGIFISFDGATGNVVQGNYIGTNVSGASALGNTLDGVNISAGAASNSIGGTTSLARNLISGNNGNGVQISGSTSTGNQIQGNFIGTQADGTSALANSVNGVLVTNSASSNTIGGTDTNSGNKIQNNGGDGVFVASGTGNAILGNSIFSHAGLGIDLGPNGVTSNDTGDIDSGANNLQNFPILTSASSSGGNTTIKGTLNSKPNTAYTLAFYSNGQCDPSGFGEGETPIGSSSVTTDASGNANLTITLASSLPIGISVTATATDPAGNTSEFSQCRSSSVETFHLSVIVTGNGSVTSTQSGIICPSDCDEDYPNATAVTLIPLARSDSKFVGWSECQGTGPCMVSMTANRSVRANFVPKLKFTLAVTVTQGGAVTSIPGGFECNGPQTCAQEYDEGKELKLVPMPIADWEFRGWQGLCLGNVGPCLVTMTGPIATTAVFGRRTERRITNPVGSPQLPITRPVNISYVFGSGSPLLSFDHSLRSGKDGALDFGRNTTDAGADNVKIELSRDNGRTFETLFANLANVGSACWTVTGPATTQSLIRVSSTSDPSIFAISDQAFAIVNPGTPGMQLAAGPTMCEALSTSDQRSPIKGTLFFADRYSFSGSVGQQVAITLTSPTLDTYLYLLGPDGSVVAQDNDGGGATDARVPATSGFITLPASGIYVIEATSNVANALGGYQLRLDSGALLLTAESTERAIALDSVTMIRDPFPLVSTLNFSSDHRTRVSLFAVNLELLPGEDTSVVTAQAEDSQHRVYPLTVEYVGKVPDFGWLTQINVRLPDQLANAGDVFVRINLRAVVGNRALINIR